RLLRAVIGYDRRTRVEISDVQAPATLLLDVEVVGLLADPRTGRFADRVVPFYIGLDLAPLLRHILGHGKGEMRHLIGDWLAFGLLLPQGMRARPSRSKPRPASTTSLPRRRFQRSCRSRHAESTDARHHRQ